MFEDSERQLDEFAHGGAQGRHLGLAPSQQALIQCLDVRVVASRHDRGQVEGGADARRAGLGQARAAVQAAARWAFDRDQAEEGGHPIGGGKVVAVRHRQQPLGGLIAHGGNRAQQGLVLFQTGIAVDVIVNRRLYAGLLLRQKGEVLLERVQDGSGCGNRLGFFQAVRFPAQVGFDGIQPGDQRWQLPDFRGGGLPTRGVSPMRHSGPALGGRGPRFWCVPPPPDRRLWLARD
jgi:hypothetical protein